MRLFMITGLGSAKDLVSDKRGAFYYTLQEFSKYWERIDVISPRVGGFGSGEKIIFGNVFIHISPWPLILHPFWFVKKGLEIYKKHKFDLMTVHEFPPFYNGIGARLLWNSIRIPYILEIHHIPGYLKAASLKEGLYRIASRYFIKCDASRAAAVRVVNRHQAQEFLIKSGVPAGKIKYIPSSYIDLQVFRPMPDVEKKYDLVFAARLEKNKGASLLLEAVAIAKVTILNLKLLIIGSGPERQNLEAIIKNLKLGQNVFLSGWLETQEDVARSYNSAKIFVNPSLNEGGPRVMLEAMACGLPVITTAVGLACDLIKDSETGLLTDWEPHHIAERIIFLLENRNLQNKFSLAGLELVKQFEKELAIKNYAEKLQDIIKS